MMTSTKLPLISAIFPADAEPEAGAVVRVCRDRCGPCLRRSVRTLPSDRARAGRIAAIKRRDQDRHGR